MGVAPSKPDFDNMTDEQFQTEINQRQLMVDKNIIENLDSLTKLLNEFNDNDTQNILEKIEKDDSLNKSVPVNIRETVKNTHARILKEINGDKEQLKSNANLQQFINKTISGDVQDKLNGFLENPFIKDDPVVSTSLKGITDSINQIRSKYKFFEYKYLQTNIFFIIFVKYISETITKFITETTAFHEARQKYNLVLIHNIVKTIQESVGAQIEGPDGKKIEFDEKDINQVSDTIKELSKNVMDSISKQKEMMEQQKAHSLKDIIEFMMKTESEFAKEMVQAVDQYKGKTTTSQGSQTPVLNQAPVQDTPAIPNQRGAPQNPLVPRPPTQFGGFIKDNSLLPQDFYEL